MIERPVPLSLVDLEISIAPERPADDVEPIRVSRLENLRLVGDELQCDAIVETQGTVHMVSTEVEIHAPAAPISRGDVTEAGMRALSTPGVCPHNRAERKVWDRAWTDEAAASLLAYRRAVRLAKEKRAKRSRAMKAARKARRKGRRS